MTSGPHQAKVLAFDVFGTVVDWHASVAREIDGMKLGMDGNAFALAWRDGYAPAMQRVMSGELGWTLIDDLHRMILDQLLQRFGITSLDEGQKRHLNRIWHRLDAWPDSAEGLTRLKTRFTICTLSNGNIGLLTNMAKRAGLPWDCILSAEVFGTHFINRRVRVRTRIDAGRRCTLAGRICACKRRPLRRQAIYRLKPLLHPCQPRFWCERVPSY
jgi:2-haloalkanoic acid dehalogenase type II